MDKSPSSGGASSNQCLNCGALLTGKYCAQCGQKHIPARQTFGELVVNFIGSFTSFESRFFKTIQYLLFRPGFLAIEYNKGRREAYYHPARAYVFISFIFFLIMFWPGGQEPAAGPSILTITRGDSTVTKKDIKGEEFNAVFDTMVSGWGSNYDSIQHTLPEGERDGWLAGLIKRRTIMLHAKFNGDARRMMDDLHQVFVGNFPKVFFLLLPVFALLLKLLYVRRDFYYTEHLVFSVQYYNFFFLASTISMLLALVSWLSWIKYVIAAWIFVYLLLAMKRMYGQSWGNTTWRYFLFLFLFMICIVTGLVVNFFVTIFII